tara:strand:+ start:249 stop:527 length:279 start_codon:yes stop_codon:yes gene_type:complete
LGPGGQRFEPSLPDHVFNDLPTPHINYFKCAAKTLTSFGPQFKGLEVDIVLLCLFNLLILNRFFGRKIMNNLDEDIDSVSARNAFVIKDRFK